MSAGKKTAADQQEKRPFDAPVDEIGEDDGDAYLDEEELRAVLAQTDADAAAADLEPSELDHDEDSLGDASDADPDAGAGSPHAALEPAYDDSVVRLPAHEDSVYSVALSIQKDTGHVLVATGGGDDRGYLWDLGVPLSGAFDGATEEPVLRIEGHSDSVVAVSFSADGKFLASAGLDGTVRIYSVADRTLAQVLDGPQVGLEWVKWHPKGPVVAAGAEDGSVWMWNANTGTYMQSFMGHTDSCSCGSFSSDGKLLVTGSRDNSIRVWNPKDGQCLHRFEGHGFHTAEVSCLAVHPQATEMHRYLAMSGAVDGSVCFSHIDNGRILVRFSEHGDHSVEAVAFSPNFAFAASVGMDGKLVIYDLVTMQVRCSCAHPDGVSCLGWHPQEPAVWSACVDGVVRLWDARTGQCLESYSGNADVIVSLTVDPTGDLLLTGADNGMAMLFKRGHFAVRADAGNASSTTTHE